MIVLDASALLELLLQTPKAAAVARATLDTERSWHIPHLADLEILQTLRRLVQAKSLADARAAEALSDYDAFSLTRHDHEPLLARIWQLRGSVSAYDAAYLALAEGLDAPLITCDARLSRTPGHRARIQLC